MNAPEKGNRETYLFKCRSINPVSSIIFQSKAYSQNHLSHNMCSHNSFQMERYIQEIRAIPPKTNAGQMRSLSAQSSLLVKKE